MGFTAGIYKYPKYKNYGVNELNIVDKYFEYYNNSWAQKHYSTVEQFLDGKSVDTKAIEYFKPFIHDEEYSKDVLWHELANWCSDGIELYNIINENKTELSEDGSCLLSKDYIVELLTKCIMKLQELQGPVDYYISHSFRDLSSADEDANDYENESEPSRVLTPCDGVVLEDENGNQRSEYTSKYILDGETYITVLSCDAETYQKYMRYCSALIKCLQETDFTKEVIVYSGGW